MFYFDFWDDNTGDISELGDFKFTKLGFDRSLKFVDAYT